jgi:hypothetical protein
MALLCLGCARLVYNTEYIQDMFGNMWNPEDDQTFDIGSDFNFDTDPIRGIPFIAQTEPQSRQGRNHTNRRPSSRFGHDRALQPISSMYVASRQGANYTRFWPDIGHPSMDSSRSEPCVGVTETFGATPLTRPPMEEPQDWTSIVESWNHWDLPILPSLTPGHPDPSSGATETFVEAPLTCPPIEEKDWQDIGRNWGGWDLPIQSSATPVHSEPSVQVTEHVMLPLTRPPTEDPRGLGEILEGVVQEIQSSKQRLDTASRMPSSSVSASRIQCAIASLLEAARWLAPDKTGVPSGSGEGVMQPRKYRPLMSSAADGPATFSTKCERCSTLNWTCVLPIWSKEAKPVSRPLFLLLSDYRLMSDRTSHVPAVVDCISIVRL